MKIKPVYIYLSAFVVFIVALVIFSGIAKEGESSKLITGKGQMPNDEIHSRMRSREGAGMPSRNDVMREAIEKMNQLKSDVAKNPNDTAKVKLLADMLVAHEPEKAIKYYEDIYKLDKKRIDVLLQLTFCYYNQGAIDKAIEYNEKILSIDNNNLYALYNVGGLAQAQGDKQKALKIWKEIATKYPKTEVGHIALQASKQLENTK